MSNQRVVPGIKHARGKLHPVFDLAHWEKMFPLGDDRDDRYATDNPRDLAIREQAVRLAKASASIGPSVPADVFVWADGEDREKPWLTKIGGKPWREKGKAWPKDEEDGSPLVFLGQICFADSKDILPCELPGDVALLFGRAGWGGWVWGWPLPVLEWSKIKLKKPADHRDVPWNGLLPIAYQGVRHRTKQYWDPKVYVPVFENLGWNGGGRQVAQMQATQIGERADLPQGWPFEPHDGCTLISVLSSFYFHGDWPLCDVRGGPIAEIGFGARDAMSLSIGDVGAIWIYTDPAGRFGVGAASG